MSGRYHNGWPLPSPLLRHVWAAVTRDPSVHLATVAEELGVGKSTIHYALCALRDAGYIDFKDGSKAARDILLPLYVGAFTITKKDHANGHR